MHKLKTFLALVLLLCTGILFAGNEQIVPVDGEKLAATLLNAQKAEDDAEEKLLATLSKLHVKDALSVKAINSNGQIGASVQPEIANKNGKVEITIGALLEFDLDKYKSNVMLPLQQVLKQVSTGEVKTFTPRIERYFIEIDNMSWEFGNVKFKHAKRLNLRLDNVGNCEVILNVLPNPTNIYASKFEAYNVRMTDKLQTAFLEKIAEANLFNINFVFKDEAGQELFHETYQAMKEGMISRDIYNIKQNEEGQRPGAEYAMFFTGRFYKRTYLPLMISPEIQGPLTGADPDGRDKQLVICRFEADAATASKIKSYDIFITEPELKK